MPAWLRIALAPLLLLGVLWAVDLTDVWRQLRQAQPGWLAAALACSVASNLASAWRWRSLVRWLGHALGAARAQRLYFQGMALGTLLPGAVVGGDLFRAVALQRGGMDAWAAGLSVLLDRLSGLWMLWLLAAGAAAWAWHGGAQAALAHWGLAQPGAALPAAALLLAAPALAWWAVRRGRVAALAQRPGSAAEFGRQVLLSTLVQLLSVGALACAGQALGLAVPFWTWAIAAAPTFLMAALPVSFGGWGTREAAAALSLAPFGVAAPAAVAASLLFGLLALPQALAGLGLLLAQRRQTQARA
ncbi:lysylphosphatidylglycerol synthase transmembrane domain-containing protein [Pseudorhodoferax sp.]|uniref:lysylphosphatidylglycerol synthase transmembrane domain-containing protein n=1 Tax=Pseudorhodoferax sp. TaxID=1993553 RepID=UPI002DD6893B|nr:lysylphosphatidylglycerol synthase transmembrane domain-containing protein [Pseudorhodoferax sp.]